MSHIVDFTIAGLAGRKETYKQTLNRDVNVFFGLNGSGKTSLLRILDSAMTTDASTLVRVPFTSAEVSIHSLNYNKNFLRTISKVDIRRESRTRRPVHHVIQAEMIAETQVATEPAVGVKPDKLAWKTKEADSKVASAKWAHVYLPTWRLYVGDQPFSVWMQRDEPFALAREQDWDFFFARNLEMLWSRYSNELLGEVRKIQGEGLANILKGILATKATRTRTQDVDSKKVYDRVAAFLSRQGSPGVLGSPEMFGKRYARDPRLRRVAQDINTIEERIENAMISRQKLEDTISNMFTGHKKVVFKDSGIDVKSDEGEEIGLPSLSSGEKHALWIFIESLLAGPNALMIDEPEISMHVDWQRGLVSAMRQLNPQAQLILATHSPEIMADLPDHAIFKL